MRLDNGPLLDIQHKFSWDELQAMFKEERLGEERRVYNL
jgi:hypothetical protein